MTYPSTLDSMLAAWNEREPGNIRAHLDVAMAANVRFVDPNSDITGIDAFEAMVSEFREQFPEAVCSRSSAVDSHHHVYRYHWEIHQAGELLIPGFDVVETEPTGRVLQILGFFGPLAAKET